jgi:hypothetical protein
MVPCQRQIFTWCVLGRSFLENLASPNCLLLLCHRYKPTIAILLVDQSLLATKMASKLSTGMVLELPKTSCRSIVPNMIAIDSASLLCTRLLRIWLLVHSRIAAGGQDTIFILSFLLWALLWCKQHGNCCPQHWCLMPLLGLSGWPISVGAIFFFAMLIILAGPLYIVVLWSSLLVYKTTTLPIDTKTTFLKPLLPMLHAHEKQVPCLDYA